MRFLFLLPLFFLTACSSVDSLYSEPELPAQPQENVETQTSETTSQSMPKSEVDRQYLDLVTKLRVLPSYEDVVKLKELYVHTQYYQPFIGVEVELSKSVKKQLDNKQWDACIATSKQLLKSNYLSLNGHYFFMACAVETKQGKLAAYHKQILNYLLDDLWNSGDGLSPQSAIKAISGAEIDSFLHIAGLSVLSKSLMEYYGKSFEKIQVQQMEDGKQFELFFDVSVAWENGFKHVSPL